MQDDPLLIAGRSFESRLIVLINWAWEYLFYDRPIRLIVRAADDRSRQPVTP